MSLETGKDTLVPATLIVPPPAGSAPICNLSAEILLSISEYLDSATCLTLSQTCHMFLELSKTWSVFWRSARFAHGHLPRVAEMDSFTGAELRSTAVKSTNLEWKWEDKSPRLVRRIALPFDSWATRNFIASGSRWLFQYGIDGFEAKVRVFDLVSNDFVHIYDSKTGVSAGVFSFQTPVPSARIIGESLSPARVLFASLSADESSILIYLATFSQNQQDRMEAVFDQQRVVYTSSGIKHCILHEGLLGITTRESVTIEQWDKPHTKRTVEILPSWFPLGLQVARDRLLLLEGDSLTSCDSWQIRIFDVTSVRRGITGPVSENDEPIPLFSINEFTLLTKPVEPFYAPYWEDRPGEPGLHFGFKVLLSSGDSLWHFNFHLDSEPNEGGTLEERLTLESTYVLGGTPEERPVGLLPGSYALGPRASRVVWVGRQGEVRIRSDWTDDLTEDGASRSRVLDLKSRPQTTPTILAFDEHLGVLLVNDTNEHHALFWFV